MTPTEKVAELIGRLIPHFPVRFSRFGEEHDHIREREWMRSLSEAIGSIDETVLARAAQRLIDTRTDRRFPLPAEIRKECDKVVREEQERRAAESLPLERKQSEWSDHRWTLADDLIKCEMGRRAAKEGWLRGLHDFARKNMRLPNQHEIPAIKRGADEFTEAYTTVVRAVGAARGNMQVLDWAAPLKLLGDKMIARQEELERRLLGESWRNR